MKPWYTRALDQLERVVVPSVPYVAAVLIGSVVAVAFIRWCG